jgi:hypothetical protein
MVEVTSRQGGTEYQWIHGAVSDHEPWVAPADSVVTQIRGRCDFCSALDPEWIVETQRRFDIVDVIEDTSVTRHDDGAWAACRPCLRYVEKRDADRLLHRAMIMARNSIPDSAPEMEEKVKEQIRGLHQAFFLAGPGAPRRIS